MSAESTPPKTHTSRVPYLHASAWGFWLPLIFPRFSVVLLSAHRTGGVRTWILGSFVESCSTLPHEEQHE